MFAAVYAAEGSSPDVLSAVAREFSPRIEVCGEREVLVDLAGLARLFGDARAIAGEVRREAAERSLRVRVAIGGTRTAARLMVRHRAGETVIEPGTEADTLAPLPIALLAGVATAHVSNTANGPNVSDGPNDMLQTFRRWGLRTLGDLAALPPDAVAARLGRSGVAWQRLARGEDPRPLLPAVPEERFEQALDLEWPIEGLEPLSFVLGRLMEPLSAHLTRCDRAAAALHVRLHLVTSHGGVTRQGGTREVHERSLELPTPIRDARTLRTLALLDLESHPPAAAIDRVEVAVDPAPGRVLQFSLLTRPLPSPEQVSTLLARLNALMGPARCGTPAAVESWQPGIFAMTPFAPSEVGVCPHETPRHRDTEFVKETLGVSVYRCPVAALRRFRFPVAARVRIEAGKPARVDSDRRGLAGGGPTGGTVTTCAGPWRTSGNWWADRAGEVGGASRAGREGWDRDEWDVALSDGATYRLFRERAANAWFIEGIVD